MFERKKERHDTMRRHQLLTCGALVLSVCALIYSAPSGVGAAGALSPTPPATVQDAMAEKQLFDLGCSTAPNESYLVRCPSIMAYGVCEDFRKAGKLKASVNGCTATGLDITRFQKMEVELLDHDCKRFLGRAGEYICESWSGGELCDLDLRTIGNGLINKCLTPRQNITSSIKETFGREPDAQDMNYWSTQVKMKKLTHQEMMKGMMDELINEELKPTIRRAFSAANLPPPGEAQLTDWMAKVAAQRLTFKQMVALLKKQPK
jgi:hypothetical protein